MNLPLVSVIIPTFNRANLLKRVINSVLSQTYEKLELIIINDDSTDNTENIIKTFHDNRIKYLKNSRNRGPQFSRNRGIYLAEGEYINFLDDDDEFYRYKIEKQINQFINSHNNKIGVITCDLFYISSISKKLQKNRLKGNIHSNLLKNYCVYGTAPMLIRKKSLKGIYFDQSLESNQEYDLMLQLSKNFEFDFLPEPLVNYYNSDNQISMNFKKKIQGTNYIFRKYIHEFISEGYGLFVYSIFRFSFLIFKYLIGFFFGKTFYRNLWKELNRFLKYACSKYRKYKYGINIQSNFDIAFRL
ncbi:MAG: glycosyltransferase family 2 protein [Promethearchaeota archaeon]